VSPELANAALRLSLGALSTPECIARTVDVLGALADKVRQPKAAPVFETVEF
jgi:cysteine sulfinate desulfinase/cysteine desulfurase-like protein